MKYWLVKQEPEDYSWDQFVLDGRTDWTGVRNHQAAAGLRAMKPGDQVLFYASCGPKEVQGIAEVVRPAFPDTSDGEPGWVAVELKPVRPLASPVTLATIKTHPKLKDIALVRQSRLSVMALEPADFREIVRLGDAKPAAPRKLSRA